MAYAIITPGGTATSVVIKGTTYTGTAYAVEDFDNIPTTETKVLQGVELVGKVGNFIADGVTFSGNKPMTSLPPSTWTNCSFVGYTSSNSGGVIGYHSVINLEGHTFKNNYAANNGGGIYVDWGPVTLENCTFIGNTASVSGSAVYTDVSFTASSCTFANNAGAVAVFGGGMGGAFTLNDCVFTENHSGIHCNGMSNSTITNCIFEGNTNGAICILGSGEARITDSSFLAEADSIELYQGAFVGTITLNSRIFEGEYHSATDESHSEVLFQGSGTGFLDARYEARGVKTTLDGVGLHQEITGGWRNSVGDKENVALVFHNSAMTEDAKIYGAGIFNNKNVGTMQVGQVSLEFTGETGMGAKALVCAGGAVNDANAKITAGTVTTTSTVASGDMGILYGGADLTNGGSFEAGTVTTTISGNARWLSFVGNGSRGGNNSKIVTTDITKTVLDISGGTFDKLVYAGAFAGGDLVKAGSTELKISGGTFNYMVFGGNGGNSIANSAKSTVTGDTHVTVTVGGANDILFNYTLFSGSYGEGLISGKTYMTFSGNNVDGTKLVFASDAYVSGGSQRAWHEGLGEKTVTYVSGGEDGSRDLNSRYLTFDGYTGKFNANMSNGFSNVEIKDSQVEFDGAGTEVDLRWVKAWTVRDTAGELDSCLTWESGQNDFAGDTINLFGWDGENAWTFMTGSDATLKGWDKASVSVDGFASDQYIIKRENNALMICAA